MEITTMQQVESLAGSLGFKVEWDSQNLGIQTWLDDGELPDFFFKKKRWRDKTPKGAKSPYLDFCWTTQHFNTEEKIVDYLTEINKFFNL